MSLVVNNFKTALSQQQKALAVRREQAVELVARLFQKKIWFFSAPSPSTQQVWNILEHVDVGNKKVFMARVLGKIKNKEQAHKCNLIFFKMFGTQPTNPRLCIDGDRYRSMDRSTQLERITSGSNLDEICGYGFEEEGPYTF